jgi:predicted nucleic acid-binding protein
MTTVKRYVDEEGRDVALRAMENASAWSTCRIGFVETIRAVGLAVGPRVVKRVENEWPAFNVVEVGPDLAECAARLTLSNELRALDALHIAAALVLPPKDLTVATWEVRLHRAARDHGLATLPVALD